MRVEVAAEVIRHKVVIAVILDGGNKTAKVLRLSKLAGLDGVKDLEELGVNGVGLAVSVCMAKVLDILSKVSEQEDVVFANLASDLDL